jgi:NADH-quinone oxidoreductase subunit N
MTMTIGNVAAIVQNNVKRMLAYSSIAHAGYALVGFIAAGAAPGIEQRNAAITAVTFYLLTYAVMNIGAFAVVQLIARAGDRRTEVEDYNGIGFRSPVLAFSLSLFLLSLLGMPLTAGFMGKIMVFRAALDQGMVILVIIGVLNTAISAYYYLRLIIVMFFRERTTSWMAPPIPASLAIALVITVGAVLYLGLFPGQVINALQVKPSVTLSLR